MIRAVLVAFLILALVLVISAFIVSLAWNAVMPYIFGLPTIDLVQAFALQVLASAIGVSARASASVSSPK